MADFADLLQRAVLDEPVVDQTGIQGRYDFALKWTPDEFQFASLGGIKPSASDSPDAPPNLYTAMQQQLGLRLESRETPVNVLVIDRAVRPSTN